MPGQLESWAAIGAVFISVGTLIYNWLTRGSRYNAKKITSIDSRMDDHEEKTSDMEQRLSAEIRKETGAVHKRVDDVARTINRVEGEVNSIGKTLNLINKHLLDSGTRKQP